MRKGYLIEGGAAGGTALLLALPLAACGSSGGFSSASGTASSRTCQQIGAILSDGPDPDSDPVGYAESQILPLDGLHPSDGSLRQAVDRLVTADKAVFAAGGTGGTSAALKTASKAADKATDRINQLCAGAGT